MHTYVTLFFMHEYFHEFYGAWQCLLQMSAISVLKCLVLCGCEALFVLMVNVSLPALQSDVARKLSDPNVAVCIRAKCLFRFGIHQILLARKRR